MYLERNSINILPYYTILHIIYTLQNLRTESQIANTSANNNPSSGPLTGTSQLPVALAHKGEIRTLRGGQASSNPVETNPNNAPVIRGKKHTTGSNNSIPSTNSNTMDGHNNSGGIYTTASGKGIYNVSDIFLGPGTSTTVSNSANNSPPGFDSATEHIKTGATAVPTANNMNTGGSSIFSFLSAPR